MVEGYLEGGTVGDCHLADFISIDCVVFVGFELGEKAGKFCFYVFEGLVLLDPFWESTLRLLSIQIPPLINLLIFLLSQDLPLPFPQSALILELILRHKILHLIIPISPLPILPSLHLLLGPSPGLWIILDILIIDSLVFIPIQSIDCLVIALLVCVEIIGIFLLFFRGSLFRLFDSLLFLTGFLRGIFVDVLLASSS